ncbi:polyprenyl synthetase family protein [Streptomyces sp. ODS05-4]|uniref:polyprenyl synthetase family protein n=1 Tax=Streptomyces sp. ODS05-4 TaxID=2944939 RepID=UPI00210BC3DE|nr:polyprenyl synthetase family protein [Streptomyces sp. ODS05-4]
MPHSLLAVPPSRGGVVPALLAEGREVTGSHLRELAARLAPPMDAVAAYHFGWIDQHGDPSAGDAGKAVRPALALLSARAAGAAAEVAAPGAVAVELVHNFSLLHDDLMDGDTTRRHRPTAWTVHGPSQAILTGDALLTLAVDVLTRVPEPEIARRATARLSSATRGLIDGQAQDLSFEARVSVGVEECLAMEGRKTGDLLGCSAAIGAVLAGADEPTADRLHTFGHDLGLAFQAVDDLLGIWGAEERTGKPRWSDLRRRKKSLPVAAALERDCPAARRLADLYAEPEPPEGETEDRLAHLAELVEEAGGRSWTEDKARALYRSALGALDGVDMPFGVREEFTAFAAFVIGRDN